MIKLDLYKGDCLELFKNIPDNSVDMVLTDPPFGTTGCKWDSVIPLGLMWYELNRIIKGNGAIVLFGSQPFTSVLITSNLKMFRYEWIWEKNSSGSFVLAKKQPMKYHENILVFSKGQPPYYPIFEEYAETTKKRYKNNSFPSCSKRIADNTLNNIQNIKRTQDEIHLNRGTYPKSIQKFKGVHNGNGERIHPTQKPVELIEYLIKTYSLENDTILDFTMGSFTTAIACLNTKRNFIGIELDDVYFKKGSERLQKHLNNLDIKPIINYYY